MSAENVQLVARALGSFIDTGEPDWAAFDEEVEIHDHDIPDQAGYRGHEGLGKWLQGWDEVWEESTVEPQEFIDAGDRVVVVLRLTAKGRGSGIELQREDGMVCEVRASKVARIDYYNAKQLALDAAGVRTS